MAAGGAAPRRRCAFSGRKVYLGVIVVLLTALHHGLTEARCRRLLEELDVPLQTLWRWRRWWREQFAQTRCWRALAGRFMPPLAVDQLPGSLLERLDRERTFRAARAAAGVDLPDARHRQALRG